MVQISGSKRRHFSSSSPTNSQADRNTLTWEAKKQLVRNRILGLQKKLEEDSGKKDKPNILTIAAEVKTGNGDVDTSTTPAMDRAKDIEAMLSSSFPTFLKPMLKSHVSGGFWLGLPQKFCREHMPKGNATMVLVDENEQEYHVKYLVEKTGLSGGWRGFSLAHKLVDGDVLIFQLIKSSKFKIYIVRARGSSQVDKCVVPQDHLASQAEQISEARTEEQSEDDETGIESPVEFHPSLKQTTSFNDFTIHMNGLVLDSELPMHLREKYYELCRSQNSVLHDSLIKGLNAKLVAGMISETAGISGAIQGVRSLSDTNRLESWDKTLKAFEDLGMELGFIRRRIHMLLSLSRELQAVIESKETERGDLERKMRDLRAELLHAEMAIKCLDDEIEGLKVKNEKLEFLFKEVASSPW